MIVTSPVHPTRPYVEVTMLSIRTVLCPVDFSASTVRQVDLAADLSRAFGARLILHHNQLVMAMGSGVGWMWAAGRADGGPTPEERLRDLQSRLPAGTDADICLTRGPIVEAIVEVARAMTADLLVLSTRGTGDQDNSVTDRLIEDASRPLFVIHDASHEHRTPRFTTASGSPQVILVPTDLTPASQPALDAAFDLSRRFGFEVHLLHVLPQGAADDRAADDARRRMTSMVPADVGQGFEPHVESGVPATVIARLADALGAACLVMGEHARRPMRRWFHPDTSRRVLHPARCPIWYVPDEARGPAASHPGAPAARLLDSVQDTSFHYWPSSYLYGIVDVPDEAESALQDMVVAGIAPDQLHVWSGPDGTAAMDSTGRHHGRAARLWRTLEKATPERDLLDRYAGEVETGHVCIGVQCAPGEEVHVLAGILKQHGGHLISYFSVGSVEHLG
jgi:nucleotide-binding universal stress UspA family protein